MSAIATRGPLRHGSRQEGQAIVEFLIAAMFFLVPLYLIVVALGKFADVQAGASQAARYAAFERTVWLSDATWRTRMNAVNNVKSGTEIRSEIAQRIVGANRLTIAANDRSRNSLGNGTLTTWTDGEGKALLERYQDLTLAESGQALGATDCLTCALPLSLNIAGLIKLGIDVPQNQLAVSSVKVAVGADSAALKRLFPADTGWNGLTLSDRVALLPNDWMANGRDGTTTVVQDAVPTSKAPIKTGLQAAILPMRLFATEVNGIKIGDIRSDEVPADRLR